MNSNAIVRTYVWGTDLSGSVQGAGGVGGLLFSNLAALSSPLHAACYDGNGNVMGLVDMALGTQSAAYEYNAFGEALIVDGVAAHANVFRFSSKFTDDETDLLYYGQRYYNPSTGRWLSRDPIGERGGANVYSFLSNNCGNGYDALGLKLEPFTDDVSKMQLSPAELEGDRLGQHVASVPDFRYSDKIRIEAEKCRTGYGFNLSFTGRLEIALTHQKGIDPATKTGADGMIINDHERGHAAISRDVWNDMVFYANRYEGCYCVKKCFDAANRVVNAYVAKAQAEYGLKNVQYDNDHYGKDYPDVKAKMGFMQERFTRAESELRAALQAFADSECSLP
jgi:RHS repeat-associated protein